MVISNRNSFQVLFDKIASVYFFWKIYNILALEMTGPGNRHCASCIGTLSVSLSALLYPTSLSSAQLGLQWTVSWLVKAHVVLTCAKRVSSSHLSVIVASDRPWTDNTATTCDWPLRRCVNLPQRRLLRSALTDALLRLFGTHCRKLSLIVTPLLCLSLG